MRTILARALFCLAACFIFLLSCSTSWAGQQSPKILTFGVCEDYDKNQDLKGIALDFQLLNQLEIDEMRVSFGWDDYEPAPGQYDFAWLHQFANLAAQYGIKLHPYICYAAPWAGSGHWNSFPNDYRDWEKFCYALAQDLKTHPNIVSYEIWNEEDITGPEGWWGGNIDQYMKLLRSGSLAIRAADPGKQILFGGLTGPRVRWLKEVTQAGYGRYYDVLPFHCYVETWPWWGTRIKEVEQALDESFYNQFLPQNENVGGGQPIWVNEIGYSTMSRSENEQANYLARAVAYFLSAPEIEHICWYEIKDNNPGNSVIGDAHNYHLGITTWPERKPKLAFYTLDMLSDLLNHKSVIPAEEEISVAVVSGSTGKLYKRLFRISDGSQILFIYDKQADCTVNVTLATPGKTAYRYALDGTSALYPDFANNTISNLQLKAGQVEIFKIVP